MSYNLLTNLEFCGDIVREMTPLLLYTHIPASCIALLVGVFVLYKTRNTTGKILFALSVTFFLWSSVNLGIWFSYDKNATMMTLWATLGILSSLLFFLTHWFVHTFSTGEHLPPWMAAVWALAIAPVLVLTPTLLNLSGVDIQNCVAVENPTFTFYYYSLGVLAIVMILISGYRGFRRSAGADDQQRSARTLILIGSLLFITAFLVTGALASYLVDLGLISDFGLEQYGVAMMGVFMGFLAYATVRYHAFNLKLLAAQALVVALVLLVGAEFIFVEKEIGRILVGVTLALAIIFGFLLVRSVKREVQQRERIQAQEAELEVANAQQENLLHFISHEVKGYLAKSEAAFAAIADGDFGAITPQLQEMSETALKDVRRGVRTIMDILEASNLKKGTTAITKAPFDLKTVVQTVTEDLRSSIEEKGLTLKVALGDGDFVMNGDEDKIRQHVIRNLVDNAMRYTLEGDISVELSRAANRIIFSVKDTGVGITPEDMKRLFTEGGHGKDSITVNVHSTGFGLFIAKQVVVGNGGTIHAESEGAGKGSRFVVEFPIE